MPEKITSKICLQTIKKRAKQLAQEYGFQQLGVTDTDLSAYEEYYFAWLKKGYHGEMSYLAKHGEKRTKPELLIPGTKRILMLRMDYLPPDSSMIPVLKDKTKGAIARYALGKDYHKLLRKRLQKFVSALQAEVGHFNYRVFTDSGPVLEKPLAEKAGLGWLGKHTVLINPKAGSWFFLATVFTDLPLPIDKPQKRHCGSCKACIEICPTKAIIAPGELDARRCISYLTIEYKGSIPLEFRVPIGNRIFGCDDCQLVCPWNKFAKITKEKAFYNLKNLAAPKLLDLYQWSEEQYLLSTAGSPLRRLGYDCWLRNLSLALGNAPYADSILRALIEKRDHPNKMVQEHIRWAIQEQERKARE